MDRELRLQKAREIAALLMARRADEMGLHGVAMVETAAIVPDQSPDFWTMTAVAVGASYDPPEATADWSPTGASYGGIAYGKVMQTHRTGDDASHTLDPDHTPLGEAPWRGCLVLQHPATNTIARISFSGGSADEDVAISVIGRDAMVGALNGLTTAACAIVPIRRGCEARGFTYYGIQRSSDSKFLAKDGSSWLENMHSDEVNLLVTEHDAEMLAERLGFRILH